MKSVLIEFKLQLEDIKRLIQFYELEKKLSQEFTFTTSNNDILLNEFAEKIKEFRLSKLKFNYNSIIISLYGIFERFIENSIVSYIEKINNIIVEYNNLPEVITKQHMLLSLTLLNKIEQPKYNGPLRKEIIIQNLHTCINTLDNYQLNKEAFAQHTANFRTQVIDESFNQIGIKNLSSKILKTNIFRDYLIDVKGFNSESDELLMIENLQILNDLAELRNYVAHGIENEILDNTLLLDFVDFFDVYSKGLIEVCLENLLYREVENKGLKLGAITDVFNDGKIVCFYTNGVKITKGQIIIGKNSKTIRSSKINNIRINEVDVDTTNDDNVEVGIEIENKFIDNFELFVIKDGT